MPSVRNEWKINYISDVMSEWDCEVLDMMRLKQRIVEREELKSRLLGRIELKSPTSNAEDFRRWVNKF